MADEAPPLAGLAGRAYYLRPLTVSDYEPLRFMELAEDAIHVYRHRSVTPSPDDFVRSQWADVLVNFAVCRRDTDELVGNVVCYRADHQAGHAWLSAFVTEKHRGAASFEVLSLFVEYLFSSFRFRKLYADIVAPNLDHMPSFPDYLFNREAAFVDDVWIQGRYHDRYVFALWRDRWIELMGQDQQRMGAQLAADLISGERV